MQRVARKVDDGLLKVFAKDSLSR